MTCFAAALPFFRRFPVELPRLRDGRRPWLHFFGTLSGDLAFTCVLFGLSKAIEPVSQVEGQVVEPPGGHHSRYHD